VYDMFKKAETAAAGNKAEKTKEREASRADLVVSQPYPDETHLLKNQVKIIWGNALYDQSQVLPCCLHVCSSYLLLQEHGCNAMEACNERN
jgi:hypothetical protein